MPLIGNLDPERFNSFTLGRYLFDELKSLHPGEWRTENRYWIHLAQRILQRMVREGVVKQVVEKKKAPRKKPAR